MRPDKGANDIVIANGGIGSEVAYRWSLMVSVALHDAVAPVHCGERIVINKPLAE